VRDLSQYGNELSDWVIKLFGYRIISWFTSVWHLANQLYAIFTWLKFTRELFLEQPLPFGSFSDLDECREPDYCEHGRCENFIGGFNCRCDRGFVKSRDKKTCVGKWNVEVYQHLMTGPEGNRDFCFLRISMFPETKSRDTLSGSNRWKTNDHFTDKWRATAVNISRVTVNSFLFDVKVFKMMPTHGIWRETVSLLDVMWPWTSEWMIAL